MELTKLPFIALIIGIIFFGGIFMISDTMSAYPAITQNSTAYVSINNTIYEIQNITTNSTTAALSPSNPENINILSLGFLSTAIDSIRQFINVGTRMSSLTALMVEQANPFIPAWIQIFITVAISLIVLLGVLYYILKVK